MDDIFYVAQRQFGIFLCRWNDFLDLSEQLVVWVGMIVLF